MSVPCSLCLEDLLETDVERRFLRCVALPGRQPGLRLHADGSVGWQTADDIACELLVSLDQQLLLYRPKGASKVRVLRAGRSVDAPHDKPVILLDADEVRVAARRLRVHIHGETTEVAPPSFVGRALAGGRSAAAMMALGATMLACDGPAHDGDSSVAPDTATGSEPVANALIESAAASATASSSATAASSTAPAASSAPPAASSSAPAPPRPKATRKRPLKQPPIEVRDMPPFME